MTKEEFLNKLKQGRLILDGATGSNLQARGMPAGVCPEEWILENREVLIKLQAEYIEAGTDIIYAPTFQETGLNLQNTGLQITLEILIKTLQAFQKMP